MIYINGKAYKKTEPHLHVSPVSVCSRMSAHEAAEKFSRCGFEAVILTNHYSRAYLRMHGGSENEWRELYLEGYHTFKEVAKHYGMEVFLGAEVTLFSWYIECYKEKYSEETIRENYADYLLYGMDEKFFRETPLLCDLTLPELSGICRDRGVLLLQAHPYRTEQGHSLKDLNFLDGLEMNANDGFPTGAHEEDCLRLAKERELVLTCGGDTHYLWNRLKSAMYIPEEIHDSVAFAKYLRKVRIPYYSTDERDPYAIPRPER